MDAQFPEATMNRPLGCVERDGYADLGMAAIYEFDVKDTSVTLAFSADGQRAHHRAAR